MTAEKNRWVCATHGVFTSSARDSWACPLCGKPGKHYGDQVLPQTTRMLKCVCGKCGYTCRTTRKWLDAAGSPICPCSGEAMDALVGGAAAADADETE